MSDAIARRPGGALRQRWELGEAVRGAWSVTASPLLVEAAAQGGVDYVCADLQHGVLSTSALLGAFQAARAGGASPMVRPPDRDPDRIGKILDMGAAGLIVPMVDSPEDAAAVMAATRYPPRGRRSFGPVRASMLTGARDPSLLEDVVIAVMVETRSGLGQVDAIAATPGIDAVYVGPVDLSLALDLPPAYAHEGGEHEKALSRILEACSNAGIVAGIHCADGEMAAARLSQGFRMVTVANDLQLVAAGVARELARCRE